MRVSNQIVLASTNRHKFEEFQALFQAYPDIRLMKANEVLRNASKLSLVETHNTYLDNATAKARLANQGAHFPCLADDSGLEVEALDNRPGVRSRRFSIPKGGQSQDQANVEKLLESLKGHPMAKRSATFHASLVLVMEGLLIHGEGKLEGKIAEAPSGENGFGYDPVFIPNGEKRTLAEMSDDEKNSISHRAKALHDLMNKIKAKSVVFARP